MTRLITIATLLTLCACATTYKKYDREKWCVKKNAQGECISWSNRKRR